MDDMTSDQINLITKAKAEKKSKTKRGPISVDNPMYGTNT